MEERAWELGTRRERHLPQHHVIADVTQILNDLKFRIF